LCVLVGSGASAGSGVGVERRPDVTVVKDADRLGTGRQLNRTGTGTGSGTGSGTGGGSLTGQGSEVLTTETAATAAQTAAQPAQTQDAVSEQLATPDAFAFEEVTPEGVETPSATGNSSSRDRRPRFDEPAQDDDDGATFAFAQDSDEFGSGILSGAEAVDRLFGR